MFGFQKLDVYRCSTTFLRHAAALTTRVPRGYSDLADQLRRAALSVPLNIAEGSCKTGRDAGRFYAIARGSALECAAIVDSLAALGVMEDAEFEELMGLLDRIVAMLTVLVRR